MTECDHNTQDFKSDLKIEVARECDMLKEGQDLKDIECEKNPGHRDFFPFKDLAVEDLPNEHRNREIFDTIQQIGSRVVRLVVDKMKNGRRIRELGSGHVTKINDKYFIQTNNHVVKTDDEVKQCTVEFHYDDDSRSNVFTSKGVKLHWTCPYRDITVFKFHPVPGFLKDWNDTMPRLVIKGKNDKIIYDDTHIISNTSKKELYSHIDLNSPLIEWMYHSWPGRSVSYLKSCNFKFQPIPFNIQELTSIEIHIDEDDGNSRVIPGDVVKCGDEFVVEISESIFQDEVKNCRLVWNSEVIGRGTRLYFKQVKASDVYSGVDIELQIERGIKNCWIFDCHPISKDKEDTHHYVCCISHPHGAIKMVTFGQSLEDSLVRFDNQYRRISSPGPDCTCKEVNCIQYTCKTCPGSSGSPVFPLNESITWSCSFNHFMGEKELGMFSDGKLMENKNLAWYP